MWLRQISAERPATALRPYAVQLALNALWSPVFFGLHQPRTALVIIVALLVAIVWTIARFWRVDRWAALLLVPYLVWVAFASSLNAGIVMLN